MPPYNHFPQLDKLFPAHPGRKLKVMAVLNITPDSFSDGGIYGDSVDNAVRAAAAMVEHGADCIDVGGESSRPGALPISADLELRRVMPVVERLIKELPVPISIDTVKARVAQHALSAGATVLNDISALRHDPAMAQIAAQHNCAVVLMHMRGAPRTMQEAPVYDNVVTEVKDFLRERAETAVAAGIAREKIMIDPGIGFGKTLEHNLELLQNLHALQEPGFPLLLGGSRKSMIAAVLGGRTVERRLAGSLAVVAHAVHMNAQMVRVHDVGDTCDLITLMEHLNPAQKETQHV